MASPPREPGRTSESRGPADLARVATLGYVLSHDLAATVAAYAVGAAAVASVVCWTLARTGSFALGPIPLAVTALACGLVALFVARVRLIRKVFREGAQVMGTVWEVESFTVTRDVADTDIQLTRYGVTYSYTYDDRRYTLMETMAGPPPPKGLDTLVVLDPRKPQRGYVVPYDRRRRR
jgi:hypothetical protein